jgi:hypothetical protein
VLRWGGRKAEVMLDSVEYVMIRWRSVIRFGFRAEITTSDGGGISVTIEISEGVVGTERRMVGRCEGVERTPGVGEFVEVEERVGVDVARSEVGCCICSWWVHTSISLGHPFISVATAQRDDFALTLSFSSQKYLFCFRGCVILVLFFFLFLCLLRGLSSSKVV